MKGLALHREFFEACGRPVLREAFPAEYRLLAAGSVGTGSDRLGADDETSRDHCWEPGFQLFSDRLTPEALRRIEDHLFAHLPREFAGVARTDCPHSPNGLRAWTIDEFFSAFTSFAQPPERERDWLLITEEALGHVTNGEVFWDPTGDFTRRRVAFGSYPENVWRAKLAARAFRVCCLLGNCARAVAHGEALAADLMLHEGVREVLHLVCLLNRRYAPYDRWLPWFVRRLPILADELAPWLDGFRATTDVQQRLDGFDGLVKLLADHVYAQGIAPRGERRPADRPYSPTWWMDLRATVTGELAELLPAWVGVEFRYASQFGLNLFGGFAALSGAEPAPALNRR